MTRTLHFENKRTQKAKIHPSVKLTCIADNAIKDCCIIYTDLHSLCGSFSGGILLLKTTKLWDSAAFIYFFDLLHSVFL